MKIMHWFLEFSKIIYVCSHQPGTEDPSWASHWCNPRPESDQMSEHSNFPNFWQNEKYHDYIDLNKAINRARDKKLSIWRELSRFWVIFCPKLQNTPPNASDHKFKTTNSKLYRLETKYNNINQALVPKVWGWLDLK